MNVSSKERREPNQSGAVARDAMPCDAGRQERVYWHGIRARSELTVDAMR